MALSYSIPFGTLCVLESANAVAAGVNFSFQPDPAGTEFSGMFSATGGTTLSADLQVSLDGGTTWTNYVATVLTNAAPSKVVAASSATPLVAGLLYRLNYTTLTGGPWTIRVQSN